MYVCCKKWMQWSKHMKQQFWISWWCVIFVVFFLVVVAADAVPALLYFNNVRLYRVWIETGLNIHKLLSAINLETGPLLIFRIYIHIQSLPNQLKMKSFHFFFFVSNVFDWRETKNQRIKRLGIFVCCSYCMIATDAYNQLYTHIEHKTLHRFIACN